MVVGLNLLRSLLGPTWLPKEVWLMRRTPAEPEAYARVFGAPCRFNAICSQLIFPASMLNLPVTPVSGTMAPETKFEVRLKLAALDELAADEWIGLVRRITLDLLLGGKCSRQAVATTLSMSTRSFNRKLAQVGTSYQELADFSRFTASRAIVSETDMPLGEVAGTLGYSNPSAFCRAFKRWTGMSPKQWRQDLVVQAPR
jgi:AraC-like DNA-binding protein